MAKFKLFKGREFVRERMAKAEVRRLGVTGKGPIDAQQASKAAASPPSEPGLKAAKISSKGAPWGRVLDAPRRMVKPKPDPAKDAKVASPSGRMDKAGRETLAALRVGSKPGVPASKRVAPSAPKPSVAARVWFGQSYHGSPRDWRFK